MFLTKVPTKVTDRITFLIRRVWHNEQKLCGSSACFREKLQKYVTHWTNGPLFFCLTRISWRRLYFAQSKLKVYVPGKLIQLRQSYLSLFKKKNCEWFIKSSKSPVRGTRILQSQERCSGKFAVCEGDGRGRRFRYTSCKSPLITSVFSFMQLYFWV